MTMKMFVWRELPRLRDYTEGLMCVIAESREEAITLAVAAFSDIYQERGEFRKELEVYQPEVIERGAAFVHGGS